MLSALSWAPTHSPLEGTIIHCPTHGKSHCKVGRAGQLRCRRVHHSTWPNRPVDTVTQRLREVDRVHRSEGAQVRSPQGSLLFGSSSRTIRAGPGTPTPQSICTTRCRMEAHQTRHTHATTVSVRPTEGALSCLGNHACACGRSSLGEARNQQHDEATADKPRVPPAEESQTCCHLHDPASSCVWGVHGHGGARAVEANPLLRSQKPATQT